MKKLGALVFVLICGVGAAGRLLAGSEVPFPADWRSWNAVSTPLTAIGALPGCDADVSALPPIYQETVETYCAVRPQGPGAVAVLVRPDSVAAYKLRNGGMGDGANMILHLKELQLLFISGHKAGAVSYGVFKEDGSDVTDANPDAPLGVNTCRVCHSGYEAFCVQGQCGTHK
ncbi:hypothetical protein [Candidatus Endoriftia persephonae]|jgi:hypothetical protein|uniref:Uncharacterized protein n=1 Tax=Candidatus Endoriftia persephonae TaxID=393765 RepID=A0A9J6ZWV0_9GAMM|nr:hypothetical protein [Candidatus Endoriftia persephone]USF87127.1 hypothetical protein L0Y14_13425 [Candidatus Endoriftia persephone]